jgi:hypothetical protein
MRASSKAGRLAEATSTYGYPAVVRMYVLIEGVTMWTNEPNDMSTAMIVPLSLGAACVHPTAR